MSFSPFLRKIDFLPEIHRQHMNAIKCYNKFTFNSLFKLIETHALFTKFKWEKFQLLHKFSQFSKTWIFFLFRFPFLPVYFGELNLLPFSCAPWVCAFCVAASLFGKDHAVPLIKIFILASAASTQKFPVATMPSPIVKCVCVCGFFSVTGILCHPILNGHMLDHDGSTKWVCSGSLWHWGSSLLPRCPRILDTSHWSHWYGRIFVWQVQSYLCMDNHNSRTQGSSTPGLWLWY